MWVEVWADYFRSRGAKHVVGDTWIPLDASFKQYEYTEGEDIASNVPFDAQALVDDLNGSITVNESEGWVEGMDQSKVEAALSNYQQQIETYINDQNPDATVGDVLGTQKVIVQEFQQLAAGLPYKLIARTNNYSVLPSNLRHKFRYTLGTEVYGRENSRLITFEQSLPELAGKKLAMSFKPATQDDEDLIASYIPAPDPVTGEIDPSQLPNTLPGYLINLTGEFTSNGEVIESAAAGTMGGELCETLALWAPGRGWRSAVNHPIAGEYRAIGLDLQGANAEDAARLLVQIEETRAILESQEEEPLATLTGHRLVGDLLSGTINRYLSVNDIEDKVQASAANIVTYRAPSYGVFSTSLQTSYWFGIPRNVSFLGVSMDVDHLETQTIARNNDEYTRINFLKGMGMRASALEHLVPEQVFSNDEGQAKGISAVKALAIASAQGQKIWQIDQNNLSAALTTINLSDEVESEIRNAVSAGKVATVHESPVAFEGGVNIGYILLDPVSGSGAYKISSGLNGGETTLPSPNASGVGMVAAVAPALVLAVGAGGVKTATFFGKVKCKLSTVLVSLAVAAALMATVYAFSSIIRVLARPELAAIIGINAQAIFKTMIVSALSLAGVANASEVYKKDCECTSGIVSEYGQCWICSKESRPVIRGRVDAAKTETGILGGCSILMSAVNVLIRIEAWSEFKEARIGENACWEPPHKGHVDQVAQAQVVIDKCIIYLPK